MTDVNLELLTQAFKPESVKSRTIGGGFKADYIDGATAIRRLNEATGNHWDFRVDRYWSEGNSRLALVTLSLPGLGARQHIGVQAEDNRSGEDALAKGAITDALKKAATLFGVALELYGPDHESGDTPSVPAPRPAPAPPPQEFASHAARQAAATGKAPGAMSLPARPAPNSGSVPQGSPYPNVAPQGCNMDMVNTYLRENGFLGGISGKANTGQCIRELEEWAAASFPTPHKVIGTGDVDPKYGPKVWPSDLYNYAAFLFAQCDDPGDPAVTVAAGGVHVPDDDVPF